MGRRAKSHIQPGCLHEPTLAQGYCNPPSMVGLHGIEPGVPNWQKTSTYDQTQHKTEHGSGRALTRAGVPWPKVTGSAPSAPKPKDPGPMWITIGSPVRPEVV